MFALLAMASQVEGRTRTWAPECKDLLNDKDDYDFCWNDWYYNTCLKPCAKEDD